MVAEAQVAFEYQALFGSFVGVRRVDRSRGHPHEQGGLLALTIDEEHADLDARVFGLAPGGGATLDDKQLFGRRPARATACVLSANVGRFALEAFGGQLDSQRLPDGSGRGLWRVARSSPATTSP